MSKASAGSPSSTDSRSFRTATPEDFAAAVGSPVFDGPLHSGGLEYQFNITSAPAFGIEDERAQTVDTAYNVFGTDGSGYVQVKRPSSEPPFFDGNDDDNSSVDEMGRPSKRVLYERNIALRSYTSDMGPPPTSIPQSSYTPSSYNSSPTPAARPYSSSSLLAPSSAYSDSYASLHAMGSSSLLPDPADMRRLSINSLLSGAPSGCAPPNQPQTPRSNSDNQETSIQYRDIYTDHTTYGVDKGIKDLDYGKNDDANAISQSCAMSGREHMSMILNTDSAVPSSDATIESIEHDTDEPFYYERPVPINIPRLLEPLPPLLLENPMNLLVCLLLLRLFSIC